MAQAQTWPNLGSGLIAASLLSVSPQMHGFWREHDPERRMNDMINFTKNMALVGGSFLAAAEPMPWRWSAQTR